MSCFAWYCGCRLWQTWFWQARFVQFRVRGKRGTRRNPKPKIPMQIGRLLVCLGKNCHKCGPKVVQGDTAMGITGCAKVHESMLSVSHFFCGSCGRHCGVASSCPHFAKLHPRSLDASLCRTTVFPHAYWFAHGSSFLPRDGSRLDMS